MFGMLKIMMSGQGYDDVLENPNNLGLDFDQNVLAYLSVTEENGFTKVVIPVSNAAKLREMILPFIDDDNLKTAGGITFVTEQSILNDNLAIGWNDDVAIATYALDGADQRVLLEELALAFDTEKMEKLADVNRNFKKFMGQNNDLSVWVGMNEYKDGMTSSGNLPISFDKARTSSVI